MAAQNSTEKSADKAIEQVEKAVNEETEQGYRGTVPDETPNRAYTVAGVLAGEPTPEAPKGK